MENIHVIQVKYYLTDQQVETLKELLPVWQNFENEGVRPFENWTIDTLFQYLMETGSKFHIEDKIRYEHY